MFLYVFCFEYTSLLQEYGFLFKEKCREQITKGCCAGVWMELSWDLTNATVRGKLGNSDSSLQLVEPAIDRFVPHEGYGRRGVGGWITHCLCAVAGLLSSSQQAHSCSFKMHTSWCVKARLAKTPGGGLGFNYSLPLKNASVIYNGYPYLVCVHVCVLLWGAAGLLTAVLWESDIPIDLHLPWETTVCMCVCACVCPLAHLSSLWPHTVAAQGFSTF